METSTIDLQATLAYMKSMMGFNKKSDKELKNIEKLKGNELLQSTKNQDS